MPKPNSFTFIINTVERLEYYDDVCNKRYRENKFKMQGTNIKHVLIMIVIIGIIFILIK